MKRLLTFTALAVLLCTDSRSIAQVAAKTDTMSRAFANPPQSARPRVWWHWMNGNITNEGIRLDLDWMEKIGLGGFAVFQGSLDTPQVVPHRLDYMSPDWKAAFKGALDEATKRKFEVAIAASPGWSETGGPWVKPAEAMKKLVWGSKDVEGGSAFRGPLPPIPHTTGTFQNYQLQREGILRTQLPPLPELASDVAVVAYRLPAADKTQAELHPKIMAHGGKVDAAALADGDVQTAAATLQSGSESYLLFDYGHAQSISATSIATTDDIVSFFGFDDQHPIAAVLEASDDGTLYRPVAEIGHSSIPQRTVAFPRTSARYFRVMFPAGVSVPTQQHVITELVLHSAARMNQWERRAGFATVPNYYEIPEVTAAPDSVVDKSDVVDLTGKLKGDGTLEWQVPAGRWRILRMGQSLVGRENEPAPAEATGLEVDKLNADYVRKYLDTYLDTYRDAVGPARMGSHGITHLLTDSVEIGSQNWTDHMLPDFQRLRGYDAKMWLPALTGVVIGSTEETDRFLWDYRRVIAQLFAQNHYAVVADELHKHGLRYYGEALEFRRPSLGDDMEMRSHADIPMAAMWTFAEQGGPNPTYVADVRGAASVAHVYGQNLVAAESMTAGPPPWTWSPNLLKRVADLEFALGVNRFEIHESTHQPLVGKAPGLTLGEFGQWFNRNETWANDAKPWIDYIARSSYLLQQGHFYGDVAYFYGEEAPITGLFGIHPQQDEPEGYSFDFVNSDVVLNRMKVQNSRLITGDGPGYSVLFLGGTSRRMTLPVLRKLQSLVEAGAVVVGDKPLDSPSLSDDQAEFHRIADRMWGGVATGGYFASGKGRVFTGHDPAAVLRGIGVPPDFTYDVKQSDARVMFLHRQTASADIYFVDSRSDRVQDVGAVFRVDGKIPELWDAATGKSSPLAYRREAGRTHVVLHLDPYGTVFVVFRRRGGPAERVLPLREEQALAVGDLNSGWHVTFPPDRGAPGEATFDRLSSWSDSSDAGIRHFSGTAVYTRDVTIAPAELHRGARVWLDLGVVKELASVQVNGKPLGIAWKTPYRLDATDALHAGVNHLQISVTNLWVNRLIGDAQPDAAKKYTFTAVLPYKASDPLLPSGLLGPVRFVSDAPENGKAGN